MDILENVIDIVAKNTELERARLQGSTPLRELGLDSLTVLEVVFQLEDRFSISLPDGATNDLGDKTLADVALLVRAVQDGTWTQPVS
jgi:acyl carrier protein